MPTAGCSLGMKLLKQSLTRQPWDRQKYRPQDHKQEKETGRLTEEGFGWFIFRF